MSRDWGYAQPSAGRARLPNNHSWVEASERFAARDS